MAAYRRRTAVRDFARLTERLEAVGAVDADHLVDQVVLILLPQRFTEQTTEIVHRQFLRRRPGLGKWKNGRWFHHPISVNAAWTCSTLTVFAWPMAAAVNA